MLGAQAGGQYRVDFVQNMAVMGWLNEVLGDQFSPKSFSHIVQNFLYLKNSSLRF